MLDLSNFLAGDVDGSDGPATDVLDACDAFRVVFGSCEDGSGSFVSDNVSVGGGAGCACFGVGVGDVDRSVTGDSIL